MLLPSRPRIAISVDFSGSFLRTPGGIIYLLLFTDCASRRADMFAVTAAKLTAEGTANVFPYRYIPLHGYARATYPWTSFI